MLLKMAKEQKAAGSEGTGDFTEYEGFVLSQHFRSGNPRHL